MVFLFHFLDDFLIKYPIFEVVVIIDRSWDSARIIVA